ncbi:hypothetical protein M409DRAFT_53927 [Zasmidium cellare ATCC 36951]|uniref:Uncharacterized protein n=1 Tax=Zasmidium cellare ATCC 36951 TaxID=1080233 RepID=A0A6A6CL25_ZASCE|nr:uncharacterized protein M409DRAFT_53927 [Zasmidium cellare ATCC 36951]KAF2167323.1 hypothetical protein M409DRAFT_53927 [Zasmidium cellare ATCC 36951]
MTAFHLSFTSSSSSLAIWPRRLQDLLSSLAGTALIPADCDRFTSQSTRQTRNPHRRTQRSTPAKYRLRSPNLIPEEISNVIYTSSDSLHPTINTGFMPSIRVQDKTLPSAFEEDESSSGRRLLRKRIPRTGRTCRSPPLDATHGRWQAPLRGTASRDEKKVLEVVKDLSQRKRETSRLNSLADVVPYIKSSYHAGGVLAHAVGRGSNSRYDVVLRRQEEARIDQVQVHMEEDALQHKMPDRQRGGIGTLLRSQRPPVPRFHISGVRGPVGFGSADDVLGRGPFSTEEQGEPEASIFGRLPATHRRVRT